MLETFLEKVKDRCKEGSKVGDDSMDFLCIVIQELHKRSAMVEDAIEVLTSNSSCNNFVRT